MKKGCFELVSINAWLLVLFFVESKKVEYCPSFYKERPMDKILCSFNWFVTACACICVGLGALGFNVLEMLHLQHIELYVRYIVGAAGLMSLVAFVMMQMNSKCPECGCGSGNCK